MPESPRTCWDGARRRPFHCGARSTSHPRLTPASILLGQIVYSDGNVADAIKIYEQALTHAPNHPHLTAKLMAWRADAEASSGFTERRFDRFRVMFQGHADNMLAARATAVLDAAFWRIGKALGTYPSEPVVVMLYTEQQFRDITQAPTWAGGIYDGRIRVPAAGAVQSPQLFQRVLVHELAHAMIASVAPRGVPTWLHEGLAQYFEGDDAAAARRRVAKTGVIPLRYLEGSFTQLTPAQATLAYDESLVIVAQLFQRPGMDWSGLFRALSESDRTEYHVRQFWFALLNARNRDRSGALTHASRRCLSAHRATRATADARPASTTS